MMTTRPSQLPTMKPLLDLPERRIELGADDPHREVLRGAAPRVTDRHLRTVDLIVTGCPADLVGRFETANETRRTDRVRRQHAARHVDRERAADLGLARVGHLPAFA